MAYLSIADFKYGMDRRRARVAGTPGTLWTLENAHITRGADIERAKKFVAKYALPAGQTFGMFSLGNQLYTFGSASAPAVPLGVLYQQLIAPSTPSMTAVVEVKSFNGQLYVIADYDDGNRYHFYNGARVTDWDVIGAASATFTTLAHFLAERVGANDAIDALAFGNVISFTATTPGTPFTISGATVDHGGTNDQTITIATPQANVPAVAEVVSSATITVNGGPAGSVTAVTVGVQTLVTKPVVWQASNEATAIRLANQIRNNALTTGYSASTQGNVVTIAALAGTGATPNGQVLSVTTSGTIAVSNDPAMAGGVTAVAAIAQISTATLAGTFQASDQFAVTINGVSYKATGLASGTGRSANVFFQRVWSPANSLWRYCKLSDATQWDPATSGSDAGFLNVAQDSDGNLNLIAAEWYSTFVVIYGEDAAVLYTLDTDPDNFAVSTTLDNTSTDAARSLVRYGNNDVFHLDPTGIRSLRALNASNAPFVSDVGNAIDPFVLDYLDTLTEAQRRAAVSTIEPRDGRLWLAVGERIFVLSFFPGAKISAWSYYSPGFQIEQFARVKRKMFARSGDTIYLYGGDDGQTYPDDDEFPVTVELPFLSAGSPATRKGIDGFDAAFSNEWDVDILIDSNREDKVVHVGIVRNKTYAAGDIPVGGQAPIIAAKLVCSKGGPATISMMQIHFEKEDEG